MSINHPKQGALVWNMYVYTRIIQWVSNRLPYLQVSIGHRLEALGIYTFSKLAGTTWTCLVIGGHTSKLWTMRERGSTPSAWRFAEGNPGKRTLTVFPNKWMVRKGKAQSIDLQQSTIKTHPAPHQLLFDRTMMGRTAPNRANIS